MDLKEFHHRLKVCLRGAGKYQRQLAERLAIQPDTLSHYLTGAANHTLTDYTVKRIITVLAEWEAITTRQQAQELLELMDLKLAGFSQAEWAIAPLNRLQATAPSAVDQAAPARTKVPNPPRHNLPCMVTAFIGREQEVARICRLLREERRRLLTLIGPGGIGKTRLSLQVAETLLNDFEHGVFFITLAAFQDPALVVTGISQSLELRETGCSSLLAGLKTYLADKNLLLVLDNFEHLLTAGSMVAELLAAAPGLKILTTSRVRLGLYGEYAFVTPTLSLPAIQEVITEPASLVQYAAVQLFVERAQAANSDFELTGENVGAVADLCNFLEGLPLAIELAAARSPLFSPQAFLLRLRGNSQPGGGARLKYLTGGASNLPARQQTLRHTLNWSYALLEAEQQQLFSRLAIFVGGFTLEAIKLICFEEEAAGSDELILERVTALVNQSILQLQPGPEGEARFGMLETLREFALEQLVQAGEFERLQQKQMDYYLGLAEAAESALGGSQQPLWINRLQAEQGNLRAALQWCSEADTRLEKGLRLTCALRLFWQWHGHFSEGRTWLDRFIQQAQAEQVAGLTGTVLYAGVLNAAGSLATNQGDYQAARLYLEESLRLMQKLGNQLGISQALIAIGKVYQVQTEGEKAWDYLERGLGVARQLGDRAAIAEALRNLVQIAQVRGELEVAWMLAEECLKLNQELGKLQEVANLLGDLGMLAMVRRDYPATRRYLEESLALRSKLGDKSGLADAFGGLSHFYFMCGEHALARRNAEECLKLKRELGDKLGMMGTLGVLGSIFFALEDYPAAKAVLQEGFQLVVELDHAVGILLGIVSAGLLTGVAGQLEVGGNLIGAGFHLLADLGIPVSAIPAFQRFCEIGIARICTRYGQAEYESAYARGQTLNLEEAFAMTRAVARS